MPIRTSTPTRRLLLLLVIAAAAPAAAQPSLADVARQEAARRKAVGTSTRIYTNKDVGRGRPLTTAAAVATPAAPAATDAEPAASADGGTTGDTEPADLLAAQREEQLATLTEAAALALGEADRLNATIATLFDEHQRRLSLEQRERHLATYRERQAQIASLKAQKAQPPRSTARPPGAPEPQPQ